MVRRPDDNCAPHAGVIAFNRVYNPSQAASAASSSGGKVH